jgi:hypothetical protein
MIFSHLIITSRSPYIMRGWLFVLKRGLQFRRQWFSAVLHVVLHRLPKGRLAHIHRLIP